MKTTLLVIAALLIGFGAAYAYQNYTNLQQENLELKEESATSPAAGTNEAVSDMVDLDEVESTEAGMASGTIGYPSEGIPALEVHAFRKEDDTYVMIKTQPNQGTFTFDNLPVGTYTFVAYELAGDNRFAGGYTPAVACGLRVDCDDHSLIEVEVTAGDEATGIEIKDWYAPEYTFPEKPVN